MECSILISGSDDIGSTSAEIVWDCYSVTIQTNSRLRRAHIFNETIITLIIIIIIIIRLVVGMMMMMMIDL